MMDQFYVSGKTVIHTDRPRPETDYIRYENGKFIRVTGFGNATSVSRNEVAAAVAILVNEMGDASGLRLWVQPDDKKTDAPRRQRGSGFFVRCGKKYLSCKNGKLVLGNRKDPNNTFRHTEISAAVAVLIHDSSVFRIRVYPDDRSA